MRRKMGGFPRGGAGGGNMQAMLKQVQAMQSQMTSAQEEIEKTVLEGSAGGGVVKCQMNGSYELLDLEIKKEAVDPEDVEMLQDLILSAISSAKAAVDELKEKKMSAFSGMMPPGLF